MTQSEIGERLRLSRQKVQRLLREARNNDVVRIIIQPIIGIQSELEKALEQRFDLREAVVVDTTNYFDEATITREIGISAAEYLLRVVKSNDKIAISWGGAMMGMANALSHIPHGHLEGVEVIQALGAMVDSKQDAHSADVVRRLSGTLNGSAILLNAPGIAGNKSIRNILYKDASVDNVLQAARSANLMFMGIGAPRKESLLVHRGNIVKWPEVEELRQMGAVGDANLHYFDRDGRKVDSDLDKRVIGLTLQDIKVIDHVVGVAGGSAKLKAIRGALNGKLIDVLVTDHVTAGHLLGKE